MPRITSFRDLEVYRAAMPAAMAILECTKRLSCPPLLAVGRAFSGKRAFRPRIAG